MALIEIKSLKKIYSQGELNEFRALDGINLEIETGEFVAIMGVSGSGKSTLMNIIGCLDKPTSGLYLLNGEEVEKKSSRELVKIRRNKIGFVFQNFNLLPRMQAVRNVELPLVYKGVRPKIRRRKAKKMLEEVGLGDRVRHKPSMLSGGEMQRVAIARALVNEPSVILADEPTGNLDTRSGRQVIDILRELNEKGTTIILVTHDAEIAKCADRVIRINDGRIEG
ncbi:ABC transporter ATP-binding protein [Patescibacteria group bacterium]|nr:ABC transporter ATP-binding protein [Patescibacteria group bacterium]MBU0964156.1 ABC transporter ATP-binding protein [Patescibacteria group bacterium]